MLATLSWFNINNKWFSRGLFTLLFIYLIVRSIFVEPLLDELGSLFWYIQTGDIVNSKTVVDANNHLLNSYVSHYFYTKFGDHLIVYRLLSILSFPIFYYSTKKLVKENITSFQTLIFVSIITVHWIFDYFGLSRGYAPSLAFFILGLCYIKTWTEHFNPFTLFFIFVSFSLSILSNLSMIIPIVIVGVYIILLFLIFWKKHTTIKKIRVLIISCLFSYVLFQLYGYIDMLKTAGALWWGSKAGLWEVTGKSLSLNVFFTDSIFLKYGIIALLIILLFGIISLFSKRGIKDMFQSIQFWSFGLFIFCLISAVILANFMGVNYPQDRVAMYLIFLLILSVGSIIPEMNQIKWGILILLWFPLSFIVKVNINTTIYSPQDRIHRSFLKEVRKIVGLNDVLSADYVAHICYAYESRGERPTKMIVTNESDQLGNPDYHLTSYYGKVKNWKGYSSVLYDPITKMKLYKRNSPNKLTLLKDSAYTKFESNELYVPLIEFALNDEIQSVQIIVDGTIDAKKDSLKMNLIEDISGNENQGRIYNATQFNWYFGHKKNNSFNYARNVFLSPVKDRKVSVYLYNPDEYPVIFTDFKIRINRID